ncbi:MAG: hypothetical protein NTY14_05695 [Candidatus Omnitrophica bacterium]|nr:hypothetical protein [Candidatus Omnitrophota bacterium]
MAKYPGNEKGFFSLIGMIVSLALICFFVYYMMNNYFKAQVSVPDESGLSSGSESSSVNYQSIISNTRNKVEEINKKSMDSLKQAEDALK